MGESDGGPQGNGKNPICKNSSRGKRQILKTPEISSGWDSIPVSNSTGSSQEFIPISSTELVESPLRRVPPPSADSPRALALNVLTRPATTVLLVNAVLLATRRMMSSGAMTCPIRRHVRQSVRRSELWESTNLSFSKDEQKTTRKAIFIIQRSKNQKRTRSINHRGLDEHRDDGLA